MALVIALISYDGHIGFGISADRSALPDLRVVSEGIGAAFTELADALQLDQPPLPTKPKRSAGPPKPKAKAKKAPKPKKAAAGKVG